VGGTVTSGVAGERIALRWGDAGAGDDAHPGMTAQAPNATPMIAADRV
jgi:hypothetical protein